MLSVSEVGLGSPPPLRRATRATSPASTVEYTPGRVVFRKICNITKKNFYACKYGVRREYEKETFIDFEHGRSYDNHARMRGRL